jgi:uncharacterized protein YbaR (Trm112 family)
MMSLPARQMPLPCTTPEGRIGASCPARRPEPRAANLMSLDTLLLNLLACPIDKQALLYLAEYDVLYNPRLHRSYRIRDGIPVMLADQGETVTDEQHRNLLRRAAAGGAVATLQVPLSSLLSDDGSGEDAA